MAGGAADAACAAHRGPRPQGDAEVDELEDAASVDDVSGLHVAMNEPRRVHGGERGSDRDADLQRRVDREHTLGVEPVAERPSAHVFHRKPEDTFRRVLHQLEEAHDVRMLDAAERPRLLDDALAREIGELVGREQLERDGAELDAAVLLDREEHRREAPLTDRGDDAKGTDSPPSQAQGAHSPADFTMI